MFAFLAVYLSVVLYSIAPTILKTDISWEEELRMNKTSSFIYSANATTTGLSSSVQWLPTIGLLLAAMITMSVLVSSFSMRRALGQ